MTINSVDRINCFIHCFSRKFCGRQFTEKPTLLFAAKKQLFKIGLCYILVLGSGRLSLFPELRMKRGKYYGIVGSVEGDRI